MKLKKWELIALLFLVAGLCLWAFWPKEAGSTALITVDGDKVAELPLSKDTAMGIDGYGGFSLHVIVENGRVRVEDSTCPDLICQNHSPISQGGEEIVCLPGRVVVEITGEEAAVDAFVG